MLSKAYFIHFRTVFQNTYFIISYLFEQFLISFSIFIRRLYSLIITLFELIIIIAAYVEALTYVRKNNFHLFSWKFWHHILYLRFFFLLFSHHIDVFNNAWLNGNMLKLLRSHLYFTHWQLWLLGLRKNRVVDSLLGEGFLRKYLLLVSLLLVWLNCCRWFKLQRLIVHS